jgi:AraC family transcriptional regulator, alkane utilization regulator
MDMLSLTLSQMRLSSSMLSRYDASAPWSVDIPDVMAITTYFMLTGECWFCPTSEMAAIHLREGDMLMMPRWQEHKLCSSPEIPAVPFADVLKRAGIHLWDPAHPLVEAVVLSDRANLDSPPDIQILTMMFKANSGYQENLVNSLPPIFHLAAEDIEFTALITVIRQFVASDIETRPSGYAAAGHRMAELILIELLRTVVIKRPEGTSGWLNGLGSPAIAAAITALHHDPQRRWTLEALAREARLSRSQFSAQFSRLVGHSAMAYVEGVRMQWATEAILRGMALKEISDALGYATPYGFHKAFVRQLGMSPGKWRKRYLQSGLKL